MAFNSTINSVPQVSAGNLLGASLVIFLLLIPMLAVIANGISAVKAMTQSNFLLLLGVIFLPTLLALDGKITATEGLVMLLLYGVLIFRLHKKHPVEDTAKEAIEKTRQELLEKRNSTALDSMKIIMGAILIFIAGHLLVEESVYFATALNVPVSFIGLLLLSIGTNIPEIVIAIRCVLSQHKDIAFGDYMGSAAANTVIMGVLAMTNGTFLIEQSEVSILAPIFFVGLLLFFFFSKTKTNLSRLEGGILLMLYTLFIAFQLVNLSRLSKSEDTNLLIMQPSNVEEFHAVAPILPTLEQEE